VGRLTYSGHRIFGWLRADPQGNFDRAEPAEDVHTLIND
jgi:hypothetical protein